MEVTWIKNTHCKFTYTTDIVAIQSWFKISKTIVFFITYRKIERPIILRWGSECPKNDRWKTGLQEGFGKTVWNASGDASGAKMTHFSFNLFCWHCCRTAADTVFLRATRSLWRIWQNVLSINTMEESPRGMKAQARECGKPGSSVLKKKIGREKSGKEEWLSLESWMVLNLWCCGHHKSPWLAQLGNTQATFGSSLALPPSPQTTQQ